mgnify:CR=1 FL=1
MVKIIDIGFGNLLSLHYSLLDINIDNKIINSPYQIEPYDKLLLPGVGSIKSYMTALKKTGFSKKILEHFNTNQLLIGICIGMQSLSNFSEEDGGVKCLQILDTKVVKMREGKNNGWIKIHLNNKFFKKKIYGRVFYNHEFGMIKNNKNFKSEKIPNRNYLSFIKKNNFYGIQFHPEKSQATGLKILKQILS